MNGSFKSEASMKLFFVILAAAGVGFGMEVNLMEPFEPSKLMGVWYVLKRNVQLLEKSARCVVVDLVETGVNREFSMFGTWTDEKNVMHNNSFIVIDDGVHPAKFVFKSDTEKIALSILGTDYDNWAAAYGTVSMKASYFVGYRKLPVDDRFAPAIQKVLDANKVGRDFVTIDHSNC